MHRKLRVLAVTRIWPNRAEPLACAFQRQQLARLREHCDVQVFGTIPKLAFADLFGDRTRAGRLDREVPKRDTIDGVPTVHPRVPYVPGAATVTALAPINAPLYFAGIAPHARDLAGKIDVVLGTFLYPDACAAAWLARGLGVPYVVKTHGTDVDVVSSWRSVQPIISSTLRGASFSLGVSRPMVERLIELGAPRARTILLRNGVDRSLFHPRDRSASRREVGLPEEGRVVLYVGRLVRDKGVVELARAMRLVMESRRADEPPIRLVVVGGEGELRSELERHASLLAKKFGEGSLVLVGGQKLARVAAYLGACDLLALPSHHEGTPNVILEALASARPVAASAVGGIPDLVKPGVTGALFPPGDVARIASAIRAALDREWSAEELVAAAPPSWEESARELFDTLDRAASRRERIAA